MSRSLISAAMVAVGLLAACSSNAGGTTETRSAASTPKPTAPRPDGKILPAAGSGSTDPASNAPTSVASASTDPDAIGAAQTSGPAGETISVVGAPNCGLTESAFCETFDTPRGDPATRTGDLDPVLWGVSRLSDANPGKSANNVVAAHLDGCGGDAATPPPVDVRICDGQMLEAVNDGGGVANLDTYPKQPFSFADRPDGGFGTVVFDVSADSGGSHAAWPEFVITDEPVPGVRRSISFQPPPHAQNEIGFSIDAGCEGQEGTTGIGVVFYTVAGEYSEVQGDRPNCITTGSRTSMNHFEVHLTQDHIDVYGTDAGSKELKLLASEDVPLAATFKQGLVWLNDVHYNARKAIEPCVCGTQFDHTFAWDNLGFDGPKTYRDLGYDVPDAHRATSNKSINGDAQIEEGYDMSDGSATFSVPGVRWDQPPTKAKVVFNAYSFDELPVSVSLNGHATVAGVWHPTDDPYNWRSMSLEVPLTDVVEGTNKITFSSKSGSTIIANPSLILVAGAPVP